MKDYEETITLKLEEATDFQWLREVFLEYEMQTHMGLADPIIDAVEPLRVEVEQLRDTIGILKEEESSGSSSSSSVGNHHLCCLAIKAIEVIHNWTKKMLVKAEAESASATNDLERMGQLHDHLISSLDAYNTVLPVKIPS